MKIIQTEIECTAEEIKASNSLAEGVVNAIRGIFNGFGNVNITEYEDTEEEE